MSTEEQPKLGDMRVWHVPQVPMKPFFIKVTTLAEAISCLIVLAKYDQFQLENRIKPDYCNAQGLERFEDLAPGEVGTAQHEWCEWEDEEGNSVQDVIERLGL